MKIFKMSREISINKVEVLKSCKYDISGMSERSGIWHKYSIEKSVIILIFKQYMICFE